VRRYPQTSAQSLENNVLVIEQTIVAQVGNGNSSLRMSEE
jgi:hypothetical protein